MSDEDQMKTTRLRLITMTSSTVHQYDPNSKSWKVISEDEPADVQVNNYADANDVNPVHWSYDIDTRKEQLPDGTLRYTVTNIICVSVMPRAEQFQLELAYRKVLSEIMGAACCNPVTENEPNMDTQPPPRRIPGGAQAVTSDEPMPDTPNEVTLPVTLPPLKSRHV